MALNWTRESSKGKHGIYLIHDGIHYNALSLRIIKKKVNKMKKVTTGRATTKHNREGQRSKTHKSYRTHL